MIRTSSFGFDVRYVLRLSAIEIRHSPGREYLFRWTRDDRPMPKRSSKPLADGQQMRRCEPAACPAKGPSEFHE